MPSNATVFVHYGPYDACGLVEHRTHRLEGLQNILQLGGHLVELKPMQDRNMVELHVNGEIVFKCNLHDLDFGGDGKLDSLCADALGKVNSAF